MLTLVLRVALQLTLLGWEGQTTGEVGVGGCEPILVIAHRPMPTPTPTPRPVAVASRTLNWR